MQQVLTGDNLAVAKTVCSQLGLPTAVCVSGAQLACASEAEVEQLAITGTLFAKLSPNQKLQIVQALQRADKVVGFLGDGTNDALALRAADVGVSVDSGMARSLLTGGVSETLTERTMARQNAMCHAMLLALMCCTTLL